MQLAVEVARPSKTQHFHLTNCTLPPHGGGTVGAVAQINLLLLDICGLCYQSAFSHLRVNNTFELPSTPLENETCQNKWLGLRFKGLDWNCG